MTKLVTLTEGYQYWVLGHDFFKDVPQVVEDETLLEYITQYDFFKIEDILEVNEPVEFDVEKATKAELDSFVELSGLEIEGYSKDLKVAEKRELVGKYLDSLVEE